MKLLDQLNLRPQEKRALVAVLVLCFVVLNWMFVLPLFGQLGVVKNDLEKTQRTLEKYTTEAGKAPTYEALEKQLKETGSDVLTEELALQRIVDTQARAAGVSVSRYTPGVRSSTGRTNQFFEDQGLSIDISTGGKELVEFLVGMASGNSAVRVQDMSLRPDASQTKLVGNILFVASYQKKTPTKAFIPTAATAPATKPATNAAPKPIVKPAVTNAVSAPTNPVKAVTNINRGIPIKPPAATNTAKSVKK